jgi:hypothetical protein
MTGFDHLGGRRFDPKLRGNVLERLKGFTVSDEEVPALGDRMRAGDFCELKALWLVSCTIMFSSLFFHGRWR